MTAQGLITDGPFVVRHLKLPAHDGDTGYEIAVKAVADLDAARNAGMHLILDVSMGWGPGKVGAAVYKVLEIPAEGGVVPLPDGSEIHVEATRWRDLFDALGFERGLNHLENRATKAFCDLCEWSSAPARSNGRGTGGIDVAHARGRIHGRSKAHRAKVLVAWNSRFGVAAQGKEGER